MDIVIAQCNRDPETVDAIYAYKNERMERGYMVGTSRLYAAQNATYADTAYLFYSDVNPANALEEYTREYNHWRAWYLTYCERKGIIQ